ncbi:MAG: phosphatase PAP2 family protein, partial [Desulfobacteraceae bacterium]|nr:phosphatase PAP2 family protein [Desulfobacteraceae bacterium]
MVSKMMTICILFCFLLSFKAQDVYGDEPVPGTGDILQLAIPAVAWGSTFAYGDSEGRNQFYKSAAACLAITHGLKFAVGEQRPNGHSKDSFPSGHTSASFFGASFIQRRYGWKFGAPAYLLASYVGWSRVETKAHYVHDVLAGAAIGVVCSYLFTTPLTENIDVVPLMGKNSAGI